MLRWLVFIGVFTSLLACAKKRTKSLNESLVYRSSNTIWPDTCQLGFEETEAAYRGKSRTAAVFIAQGKEELFRHYLIKSHMYSRINAFRNIKQNRKVYFQGINREKALTAEGNRFIEKFDFYKEFLTVTLMTMSAVSDLPDSALEIRLNHETMRIKQVELIGYKLGAETSRDLLCL